MRAKGILLAGLAVIALGHVVFADTHSDFNKGYNLAALKTFDLKKFYSDVKKSTATKP